MFDASDGEKFRVLGSLSRYAGRGSKRRVSRPVTEHFGRELAFGGCW